MIRRSLSELDSINCTKETLSFEAVEKKIINSAINKIYVLDHKRMVGELCISDLYKKEIEDLNKDFPFVYENEYVKAKELLYNNDNELDSVACLDKNMNITGDYIKNSETEWCILNMHLLERIDLLQTKIYTLYAPRFEHNYELFKNAHQYIQNVDYDFNIVNDFKIFMDKFDMQCYLYECDKRNIKTGNTSTLYDFLQTILFEFKKEKLKKSLAGVKIYTFNFTMRNISKTEYIKEYKETMKYRKTICVGRNFSVPDELKYTFLDDLYSDEYWDAFKGKSYPQYKKNGITYLKNCNSKYINIENGIRVTLEQPATYENSIYFIGACVFVGSRVEDKNTIPSVIQSLVNKEGKPYKVINLSSWDDINGRIWKIINHTFKQGDIVIIHAIGTIDGVEDINAPEIALKNAMPWEWFTDSFAHCNHHAAETYANAIYNTIKKDLTLCDKKNETIHARKEYIKDTYINRFFNNINLFDYEKVGCIVMNCNPFTNGHRYLIESSLKYVDFLIIFVVEEEKSYFRFEDRIAMVKLGVEDLKNVMVVPSGDFILSSSTFPEYFIKIMDEDITNNVDFDIELFAQCIAPELNIKYRFVGTEHHDIVTAQYNDAMRRILHEYGINLIEIERKTSNDEIISASRVRKFFEYNMYYKMSDMVPQTTLDYLKIKKRENTYHQVYVIDSRCEENGWYRVYSDGFCEQFGVFVIEKPVDAGGYFNFSINLYKEFYDNNYSIMLTFSMSNMTEQEYSSGEEINYFNKQKKQFSVHYHNRNGRKSIPANASIEWRAAGYVFHL